MTTAFTTAKIVGLTGAAWLSGRFRPPKYCLQNSRSEILGANQILGTIASLSLISIPAISRSIKEDNLPAAHAVKLWRNNYEAGFALAPPTALATAASLAFCAWTTRNLPALGLRNGRLFWVAAALTVGIVPYTLILMKSTNDKLHRFAKKAEKEELSTYEIGESEQLLKRWGTLNAVRSLLPLTGAILAGVVVLA